MNRPEMSRPMMSHPQDELTVLNRPVMNWPVWNNRESDDLRMKFSALNVDFSNPNLDPLGSRRLAHASVKEQYPSKKWLFICCWLVWHENGCR